MGKGKRREEQGPGRYVNREYSWLQFNARVLAEGENEGNPLIERGKFLAIFESNLDEFFMVRVSGLIEQQDAQLTTVTPDGLTAGEQLDMVSDEVAPLRTRAARAWSKGLVKDLERAGIRFLDPAELGKVERRKIEESFLADVFPLLTPLMMSPSLTFPFISNRSLNLAVQLDDGGEEKWARVKVPPVVPRLVPVPGAVGKFVLLEDLMAVYLPRLFPGVKVVGSHVFRVVRDADIEIRELEAADLIDAVEKTLRLRRYGDPVFLEVCASMPKVCRSLLMSGLDLGGSDVFVVEGRIGMDFLWELSETERPDLKFAPHKPVTSLPPGDYDTLFARIRAGDLLVHHPYDSFSTVLDFVRSAARDPNVIGIKQTLYRVGGESPIVEALLEAAEAGKQVAAMVELKARFDESNNLVWSRALERAGVHVTYGMMDLKVHCKLCLVVRKEADGMRTYAHVGTGNYNPTTASLYTDLGLFTDDADICRDVSELFNFLTGLSRQTEYRKLLVAPFDLREQVISRIERETAVHARQGGGRIRFKLNSLVDPEVIDALYEASDAGVSVDLVVRGTCCLRPGLRGLSENIRVVSIVGRFLEHSRIYAFENGGSPEAFIGSADMMRRNLDRRIEALVPVTDPAQVRYLTDVVIGSALADGTNAWEGRADGSYRKVKSGLTACQGFLAGRPAAGL